MFKDKLNKFLGKDENTGENNNIFLLSNNLLHINYII